MVFGITIILLYFRSTRPVTVDKWFSFSLHLQNEHKEIASNISARGAKKNTNLPSNPLTQVSEFKTGASLSSISVAFHGEVIVEYWEKKSADYRQYIHALPWEGAGKASAL